MDIPKTNTGKSPGPDKIHNKVLFEARHELKSTLTKLFNKYLQSGNISSIKKIADVTPILEKGKKKFQTTTDWIVLHPLCAVYWRG